MNNNNVDFLTVHPGAGMTGGAGSTAGGMAGCRGMHQTMGRATMHPCRRQRGVGALGILVILILLGFFALLGVKLIPVYTEYFEVRSIVHQVAEELSGTKAGRTEIRQALQRRFDLNNVTGVGRDDIVISTSRDSTSIVVAYDVRVSFLFNIDLIASFSEEALVRP